MTADERLVQKAHGCLAGLALGDALGLPTEMLAPEIIAAWYDEIRGLTPIAAQHPHNRLPLASVSDDTDQALLIARLLVADGEIRPQRLADGLLAWAETPRVRDNNFLGRATRQALTALVAGAPVELSGRGETIGAAMRIAPVALTCATRERLIEQVVNACLPTHFTQPAISGAMAVAFGVQAALEPDATTRSMIAAASEGARIGATYGAWGWTPPLDQRLPWALQAVQGRTLPEATRFVYEVIGVGEAPWELVTAAFVLLHAAEGEPMPALLAAANCGGDTDTLGAIVGALGGALGGIESLDQAMLSQVCRVNGLDLEPLARQLVSLRRS